METHPLRVFQPAATAERFRETRMGDHPVALSRANARPFDKFGVEYP